MERKELEEMANEVELEQHSLKGISLLNYLISFGMRTVYHAIIEPISFKVTGKWPTDEENRIYIRYLVELSLMHGESPESNLPENYVED